MSKICFVTYEIHPVTAGGCGVLLYNAAQVLLNQGHEVIFLVEVRRHQFMKFDPGIYPNSDNCRAYLVEDLCKDLDLGPQDFATCIQYQLWRFYQAALRVYELEQPDIIEFFDYNGSGHYALAAKVGLGRFAGCRLAVRLHNSDQLMNIHQPQFELSDEFYMIYAMEKSALRLAENVLYPSQSYLDRTYRPHPEACLGEKLLSRPPLLDHPRPICQEPQRDVVLFYGRLFGFKGVDLFVDAVVSLLSRGEMEGARFVLAGYDSGQPPDESSDYREYLLKRVPAGLRQRLEFPGQLSWPDLGELLPRVACAVIPSYLESFCYAAQELYEAGVPLIVNDISVFADYFRHEDNALVFDGTAAGLADSLRRLWDDAPLRDRLCRPYCVTDDPLGDFYREPSAPSWVELDRPSPPPGEVLVVVVAKPGKDLSRTLESLAEQNGVRQRVVVLEELRADAEDESGALNFLGRLRRTRDSEGNPLAAGRLYSAEYLLVLEAGDELLPGYLHTALGVLAAQPQLSWVGCWKSRRSALGGRLDTFPLDACGELVPWMGQSLLSRAMTRTPAGLLLGDLFDPRLLDMGELGHLWSLESSLGPGLVLPRALLKIDQEKPPKINRRVLSYLVLGDEDPERKRRLSAYLVARDHAQADQAPLSRDVEPRPLGQGGRSLAMKVGRRLLGPILYHFCFQLYKWLAGEAGRGALLLHLPERGLRLGYLFDLFLAKTGRTEPCPQAAPWASPAELAGACLAASPQEALRLLAQRLPLKTLGELADLVLSAAANPCRLDLTDQGLADRHLDEEALSALAGGRGPLAAGLRAWGRAQAARLDQCLLWAPDKLRRVILLHPEPRPTEAALLAQCLPDMAWSFCHPALPAKGAGSWKGPGRVLGRETAGSTTAGDEGFNPAYLFSDYLALPYPRLMGQKENSRLPRVDGLGPVREEEVLRGITACFERVDAAWGEQEVYEKARRAWHCLARLMQYPALPQVEVLAGRPRPGRDDRPRVLPPEGGFDLGRKLARIRQAEWAAGQVALEFPSIHWWLQSIIKLLRIP